MGENINILLNKNLRKLVLLGIDIILVQLAAYISLEICFDFTSNTQYMMYKVIYQEHMIPYIIIMILTFYAFGLYRSLWRYASINEMISVIMASFWSNAVIFGIFLLMKVIFPKNFYIINIFMIAALIGGFRFSYRALRRLKIDRYSYKKTRRKERPYKKILILGAGDAGALTAKELLKQMDNASIAAGFLDDDPNKIGKKINGIPVLDNIDNVAEIVDSYEIEEIILAIPTISNKRKKEILECCKETGVKMRILPGIYELIDGKVHVEQIRDVQIEDLLGRETVKLDNPRIQQDIQGKVVLVTGGGGSIGSELCRQIAKFNPKQLVIFDIYENTTYDVQNELLGSFPDLDLEVLIGSVRDTRRLEHVFEEYRPQIVFHAAAHKHVPLMEQSPFEAIKNNSIGTLNTAHVAGKHGVSRFVFISTDKAVNPTNIMGASKRISEIIIQNIDAIYPDTEFVAVRFGNVLGSNGSVIPLFKKQIEKGGPITVTHPEIIRYFMTIPEAAQLVLQAGTMAKGGEIFVLDMGEPVKIVSLAEDLIRLSGFEPYEDIEIKFTGLRPGEKLYEELLLDEEGIEHTGHEKIFIGKPLNIKREFIEENLKQLKQSIENNDIIKLEKNIRNLVPNYKNKNQVQNP
ncbi:MAG: nucleoside-diphosphate sugar epimerase/dehydratase [Proteocatella sp.]